MFASLYWRRVTRAGAIASVIAMAVTWFSLFWVGLVKRPADAEGDFLVAGMMPVTVIFAVTAVVLVVVSLLTRPPSDEVVARYLDRGEN